VFLGVVCHPWASSWHILHVCKI